MAYFTGTPPETWAPIRFRKLKFRGVAGSGANAPIERAPPAAPPVARY